MLRHIPLIEATRGFCMMSLARRGLSQPVGRIIGSLSCAFEACTGGGLRAVFAPAYMIGQCILWAAGNEPSSTSQRRERPPRGSCGQQMCWPASSIARVH